MRQERGAVLGVVVITAFVCAVAAAAALTMSTHRAHVSYRFDEDRLLSRAAAEAGMVWAMERLWSNPNFCAPSNQDLLLNGHVVDVQISNCGAGNSHEITAVVTD